MVSSRRAGLFSTFGWPLLHLIFLSAPLFAEEVSSNELKKLKAELATLLRSKNAGKIDAYVGRVAKIDNPEVAELLVQAAVDFASSKNYDAAVQAIAKFSDPKTVAGLVELSAKAKEYRWRVLVLEGFGRRKDAGTRKAIHDATGDKLVQVQVAGIRSCVARKEKEGIPVLIDLVGKNARNRDRVWIEARQALLDLTGQDYELIDDWKKFWDSNKNSFDPKKLGKSEGPTAVKVKVRKVEESVEFFGKEILSRNIVFVLDCSGSMIIYGDDSDYKGKNIEYDRMRLTRAKSQMIALIQKLKGPRLLFNIIAFSDRILPWRKSIVQSNNEAVSSAVKFVKGFRADGLTHTDEALEKAFQDMGIDTIVLLSDGAPMRQDNPNSTELQEKILKRVKDLNASRKVRIDTFGFEDDGKYPKHVGAPPGAGASGGADSAMVEFLKKLAQQNGGEYHPIK